MVKPTHLHSNPRFDVYVIYLWLIILSDIFIDNETLFDRFYKFWDQADSIFQMCSYKYGVRAYIYKSEYLYVYVYEYLRLHCMT
jgi:hypothetical protein